MCGIFGFSGRRKPNLAKMKILGIYNTKRGKDSCGYFYNGSITKGAEFSNKEFPDFIQKHIMQDVAKPKSNVFIGHTRSASVGSTTIENCHPFNINNRYVLAHNGTIDNIWDLCEKYDIDVTNVNVDSKALGLLFNKVGPSILNEYRGYAALLIHDLEDAKSLYVYHGASKQWDYKTAEVLEERPLFGMETREGIYFSSLEEALLAIRDVEGQKPFKVEHNKLIKVSESDYGVEVFDVEREYNNVGINTQKKTTTVHYPTQTPKNTTTTTDFATTNLAASRQQAMMAANIKTPKLAEFLNEGPIEIADETLPIRMFLLEQLNVEDYVFFWKGRYYDQNENLLEGRYFLNNEGWIFDAADNGIYEYYFYRGILLKGKVDYDTIITAIHEQNQLGLSLINPHNNFASIISSYSRYPVTNIQYEASAIKNTFIRDAWYQNYISAAGGFTPLFSDRNYTFKAGNLTSIRNNNNDAQDIIIAGEGVTKYANQDFTFDTVESDKKKEKTNLEVKENQSVLKTTFINGESIKINKDLSFFKACFDRIWESHSIFENQVPYCVYLAINFYLRDVLTAAKTNPTQKDLDNAYNSLIETAIYDKVPLKDLMAFEEFSSMDWYLKKAIKQECNEDLSDESPLITEEDYLPFEDIHHADNEKLNLTAYDKAYAEVFKEKREEEQREIDDAFSREFERRELAKANKKNNNGTL